jgi:hypothetical protein
MVERDLRKVEMAVRFRLAPKFEKKRYYPFSVRLAQIRFFFPLSK